MRFALVGGENTPGTWRLIRGHLRRGVSAMGTMGHEQRAPVTQLRGLDGVSGVSGKRSWTSNLLTRGNIDSQLQPLLLLVGPEGFTR